jgi:hypothetical protein
MGKLLRKIGLAKERRSEPRLKLTVMVVVSEPSSGKPDRYFEEGSERPIVLRPQAGRAGLVHIAFP